ncbi:MAG TPA: hypothetical protein VK785_07515 [Opitutaceae bacterium]|jgi:hypothetical protein|nr:hypothetical protein [Opitutaceae bacterium]
MNLLNALGFFVFGLAMLVAAELTPAVVYFGPLADDTSALWLEFMGAIMFLIGLCGTAKCLVAALPKPAPREKVPAAVLAHSRAHAHSSLASSGNRATA